MSMVNIYLKYCIIPITILCLVSCNNEQQDKDIETYTDNTVWQTKEVLYTKFPEVITYPGTVISDDSITLSSRVVGFIQNVSAREGQTVSAGELLVSIDPSDIDSAIHQAEATLVSAKKNLEDISTDVAIREPLVNHGAISKDQYRKSVIARDIAQANVRKADALLTAAREDRKYTNIVSPVDGVVTQRFVRSGEMTTSGAKLLTIESRKLLLFKIYVPEHQLPSIKIQMPFDISIDAIPGRTFSGIIKDIVPSGDPVTRRYEVNIALPDDPQLYAGMFGRGITVLKTKSVIAVPQLSITNRGGVDGVFSVDSNSIAHFHWIRTGYQWKGMTEITAGIHNGELIVAMPNDKLLDGMKIHTERIENVAHQ